MRIAESVTIPTRVDAGSAEFDPRASGDPKHLALIVTALFLAGLGLSWYLFPTLCRAGAAIVGSPRFPFRSTTVSRETLRARKTVAPAPGKGVSGPERPVSLAEILEVFVRFNPDPDAAQMIADSLAANGPINRAWDFFQRTRNRAALLRAFSQGGDFQRLVAQAGRDPGLKATLDEAMRALGVGRSLDALSFGWAAARPGRRSQPGGLAEGGVRRFDPVAPPAKPALPSGARRAPGAGAKDPASWTANSAHTGGSAALEGSGKTGGAETTLAPGDRLMTTTPLARPPDVGLSVGEDAPISCDDLQDWSDISGLNDEELASMRHVIDAMSTGQSIQSACAGQVTGCAAIMTCCRQSAACDAILRGGGPRLPGGPQPVAPTPPPAGPGVGPAPARPEPACGGKTCQAPTRLDAGTCACVEPPCKRACTTKERLDVDKCACIPVKCAGTCVSGKTMNEETCTCVEPEEPDPCEGTRTGFRQWQDGGQCIKETYTCVCGGAPYVRPTGNGCGYNGGPDPSLPDMNQRNDCSKCKDGSCSDCPGTPDNPTSWTGAWSQPCRKK